MITCLLSRYLATIRAYTDRHTDWSEGFKQYAAEMGLRCHDIHAEFHEDCIECSLCGIIRRPEHLSGRHRSLPANWRSFVQWSPDQWVSQCYAIECDRIFYCALFCVFMTRVSRCPFSLCAEDIMASESISSAYVLNPTHQFVCLYVYLSYRCWETVQQKMLPP
jgi:hypothetical protein